MCRECDEFERYNHDAFKKGPSKYELYNKYNILTDYNMDYDLDSFLEIYPEYIDIEELAKLLGISPDTVKLYVRKGILPPPIKSEIITYKGNNGGIVESGNKKFFWDVNAAMDWFYDMKEILDIERKHKWKKYGNYCEYFKVKCNDENKDD